MVAADGIGAFGSRVTAWMWSSETCVDWDGSWQCVRKPGASEVVLWDRVNGKLRCARGINVRRAEPKRSPGQWPRTFARLEYG